MKIRTDYVTNSSSSSFVLGFKSESEIGYALGKEELLDERYFDTVLKDCQKAVKMSKEDVLLLVEDEVSWWIEYSTKNEETAAKKISERISRTEKEIDKKGYNVFVELEYADDENPELEYNIMRNLKCCVDTFSHH